MHVALCFVLFFLQYIFTVLTPLGIKRSNPCEVERGTCGRARFSGGMKVHKHAFGGWKRQPPLGERCGAANYICKIVIRIRDGGVSQDKQKTTPDLPPTSLVRFCRCSTWIVDARASGQSSLHSHSHKQTPIPPARRRRMCFLKQKKKNPSSLSFRQHLCVILVHLRHVTWKLHSTISTFLCFQRTQKQRLSCLPLRHTSASNLFRCQAE